MWLSFMLTVTSRSTVHSYAMQPIQIELDNSPLKANLHLQHIFSLRIRLGFWPHTKSGTLKSSEVCVCNYPVCWQELTGWFGSRVGNMWPLQFWRKITWMHCSALFTLLLVQNEEEDKSLRHGPRDWFSACS
jgi:hypothetical protein